MPPRANPQTALDERVVEDSALESALNDRERAKGGAAEARKTYQTKDEVAKGKIEELGLTTGQVVRVGRFRIEQRATAARDVQFTVESGSRLSIKVEDDD